MVDIRSDRRFPFEDERATVWSAITRVDRYSTWWPWLSEFEGSTFDTGATWSCVVKPPLPYALRFDVTLTEVVEGEVARAEIAGDITGWAELTATDHGDGCELRLISELTPESAVLRLVSRMVRPVASFGHDWVLDTGARQFRDVALRP